MRVLVIGIMLAVGVIFIGGNTSVSAQSNPEEGKKVVKVKRGDTLSKIAKKNDTTYKRLFNANVKIKDPDVIYPGQKVKIPAKDEKLKNRALPQAVANVSTPQTSYARSYSSSQQPVRHQASSTGGGVWDRLASCESGGNWSINTGNGYYGGLQFTPGSWRAAGGSGYPHQASKAEQIKRGKILQSKQGWGAWPACTSKLGIR